MESAEPAPAPAEPAAEATPAAAADATPATPAAASPEAVVPQDNAADVIPAPSKSLGASEPAPPLSTTMKCVLNLTVQFFVIYTMLYIVMTMNKFAGKATSELQKILERAEATVFYAPMLCILFVG